MTQAAVSYQIRLLEERLGVGLFRREKKKVMLTDAGRRASGDVSRAFDVLDAAFSALWAEDEGTLTITTSYTLANTWFPWRLGAFQMTHPEMAVRMLTDDAAVGFDGTDRHCGVRPGQGASPGRASQPLSR